MSQESTEQYVAHQPSAYSRLLNEIRNDFNLDEMQGFDDEHYWNEESDLEFLYHTTSQEYMEFLLSYE